MSNPKIVWRIINTAFIVLSEGVFCGTSFGQTNVLTYHNDNFRTGQNLNESILTLSDVNPLSFGNLFTVRVDGKVDAQPLYVSMLNIPGLGTRNLVFTATEHDTVYAFDADSGAIYWQESLLKYGESPSDARGCNQVVPEIGITATPVIDLQAGPNGTIYIVAMSKDSRGNYFQRLHALDITTGAEQSGGPVDINATYPGGGENSANGTVVFDPKQYKSRAGLLLDNGVVYTSWSSHCDFQPYTGWLIAYNESSLAQTGVLNFAPNGEGASIWASGAGPASDGAGHLFFNLANGTFDTTLDSNGFPANGDYGNALVRVSTFNGQLIPDSYWTMYNSGAESSIDEDLGSGGIMLLPPVTSNDGRVHNLAVGAGKDRNIYVVEQANMGGFNPNDNSNIYQELPQALAGPEFGMSVWFNGQVYFGAVNDSIKAFGMNDGKLSSSPGSQTAHVFGFPGATPSISANGNASGILWAAENTDPAVLHAFDASNLSNEIYNSGVAPDGRDNFGPGNKFITPTIANGKVFVGSTNSVGAFGLLNVGPGPVQLIAQNSGKCLDVRGISMDDGAPLQQWSCWGGPNQQWYLSPTGAGSYQLTSLNTGMAVTATAPGDNGSGTIQSPYQGGTSQRWVLEPASNGYYQIVAVNSGKCLDVTGGPSSLDDGVAVQQWACWAGSNQQWRLSPL